MVRGCGKSSARAQIPGTEKGATGRAKRAKEPWHVFRPSGPGMESLMAPAIEKIVVPIDFTEASERAARYACALARRVGASLHLIHVLEAPAFGSRLFEAHAAERRERLYQSARLRLGALVARLGTDPCPIATEVRYGTPADSIGEAARHYGASLVVMATHGRRGLAHLMAGSVAERVMRTAACPVLVVRESGQVHVHGAAVRARARDSAQPTQAPQVKAAS